MNPYLQSCLRVAIAASCLAAWGGTSGCATGTAQASIAANASAGAQSDDQAVSAIRDAIRRYVTALNANALDEILGQYGSDPVFMPQHAPALIGRDAVRAGYQQVLQTIQLNIRFQIHEVQRPGEWA